MIFRNFRYALEFAPVWALDKLLGALPRNLCLNAGEVVGMFASFFFLRRNKLIRANLAKAFPDLSKRERERIRRGVWKNLGRVGAEFIRLSEIHRDNFRRYIRVENEPLVKEAREKGKGLILVGFHFTNWEVTGL